MNKKSQAEAALIAAKVTANAAMEATKTAEQAVMVAQDVVDKATKVAENLIDNSDERVTKALATALREVFGENEDKQRFVDVSRIPLICKSILDIHENISDIKLMIADTKDNFVNKDQFWPIKTIVYGGVGATLLAVIGAVIALILKQ